MSDVPKEPVEDNEAGLTDGQKLMKKIGRPSSYREEYAAELIDWCFVKEPYSKETIEETTFYNKEGNKTKEIKKFKFIPANLPTLEAFARHIGVTYTTMYRWATEVEADHKPENPKYKHPEFRKAYNIAKQLQKEFLINNGLAGMYPPASYIFTAKNVTDMADEQVLKTKDSNLEKKRDALDDFLDTLQDNAANKPAEEGTA